MNERQDVIDLHRAYKRVFETEDGKTVLADLERRGCFLRSSFSTDPGRTEFNEGRRSLVLHVHHMKDHNNFIQEDKR